MAYKDKSVKDPAAFEKLGAFYLGKTYDSQTREVRPELLLYDSKDLTTHAVCVGMTGSGKTGLCLSLLEEAAIDGIPAIAIDPKGDLGNLLLGFPELLANDFAPWVDPGEAARKGMEPNDYAADRARLWRRGLADWGQDGRRIARLRAAADVAIYTPGSNAGLPLSMLRSFAAPPPALLEDAEAFRERVSASVSGLLALLGVDADPVRSREHILLSKILQESWQANRDLEIADLIRAIQSPPFQQIGVMDIESVYPEKDRFALSMSLNNLLAAPGFDAWLNGAPLDAGSLLWTPDGRPRIAIISIAHLNDAERMFFVTSVLNEILGWTRAQSGTSSLRALLYMDEVFGYFPPTANPPSKTPMLTLLKQARAFGVGVVLATQNPVDLDYKGLSNAGTWFIGRLQTDRDKQRLLDGLEGAAASSGSTFDRAAADRILSGLGSRVFLMNNVHEDAPVLFHTRWALSYLRGPLSRHEIKTLMADRKKKDVAGKAPSRDMRADAPTAAAPKPPRKKEAKTASAERPLLPPGVPEVFLRPEAGSVAETGLLYRPSLLGEADLHYTNRKAKLDSWHRVVCLAELGDATGDPWEDASVREGETALSFDKKPAAGRFSALPGAIANPKRFKTWERGFKSHLYQNAKLVLHTCAALGMSGEAGESLGEFRVRAREEMHRRRDIEVEKLRNKYAPKLARLKDRIATAEAALDRQQAQYDKSKLDAAISLGTTVLGALFGRKLASTSTASRAGTTARAATRAARERGDVKRAEAKIAALVEKQAALSEAFESEVESKRDAFDPEALEITQTEIAPRKSDISIERLAIAWAPWRRNPDGSFDPLWS